MKPFRLRCIGVAAFFLAHAFKTMAVDVNLQASALYELKSSCTGAISTLPAPVLVTATIAAGTCTPSTTCTVNGDSLFPSTVCATSNGLATGDFVSSKLPELFGSSPFVSVDVYSADGCAADKLTSSTTYLADGECHKTGSASSYKATRGSDKSINIKTYAIGDCSSDTPSAVVEAADEAKGIECSATSALAKKKVYGSGYTMFLTSTATYDTKAGECKSPALPIQALTTSAPSVMASSADTKPIGCVTPVACVGAASPYTSVTCGSVYSYKKEMAAAFGTNPYLFVEKYTKGQTCNAASLSGLAAYLADGICHKTGPTASYVATRAADGSASIKTYTVAGCTGDVATSQTVAVDQAKQCVTGTSEDTKVYGSGVTTYLTSTVSYDTNTDKCKSPAVPIQATTTSVATMSTSTTANACTATSTCSNSEAPFTGTTCGSPYSFKRAMAAAFGSNPYVIVEKYAEGAKCDVSQILSVNGYLADGLCHKTGSSESYLATRFADGTASIKTYTDSATCANTASSSLAVTAAQATGNSCTGGETGILDTKVYGYGVTLYLTSTVVYDTKADNCKSPGLATLATAGIVIMTDTNANQKPTGCTTSAQCAGSTTPYTGTTCGSVYSFKMERAAAFGSNPYVIVETYSGDSCQDEQLTAITAYLADGMCHKTDTEKSYKATRAADGFMSVTTYPNNACQASSNSGVVSVASATAGNTCTFNQKLYGSGVTAFVMSTMTYDTETGDCESPTLATQAVTASIDYMTSSSSTAPSSCISSAQCAGILAPFTGTTCGSVYTYKMDLAAAFGSNPYVIVESYTQGNCEGDKLTSMASYLADGMCHKTGSSASYLATRAADGTAAIKTYTDSATCATTGSLRSVTAAQAAGNSCANNDNGIANKKVYGSGVTLYLTSTLSYDTNTDQCMSPGVAMRATTATVSPENTCSPSKDCVNSVAPFTGTKCGSLYSLKLDMEIMSRSNAYLIVEKYTDLKECAGSELASVDMYLADGVCHKDGDSTSYLATRAASGLATIKTYADSDSCGTTGVLISISVNQATGNSCADDTKGILNTKIYGGGATLYLTSTLSYDTDADTCTIPALAIFGSATSPVTTKPGICQKASQCSSAPAPFTGTPATTCSSPYSFTMDMAASFGLKPYVIVESYTTGNCEGEKLTGMTAYVADGECHKTGSAASYSATRSADGAAVVKTYTNALCTGSPAATPVDMTAAQAKGQSCSAGAYGIADKKVYGAGVTTVYLSSVSGFDTNVGSCAAPVVPTSVTTTLVSSTACTAVPGCTGTADPWTSTSCGTNSSFQADVLKLFGSQPYVTVEKYTDGTRCDGTKLASITTYLADGKCHKTASAASYTATRATDGSAIVKAYANALCTGSPSTTLDVTATQAKGNSCAGDDTGVANRKVYGDGVTTLTLSLALGFETNVGACVSPSIPTSVTTALSASTCAASAACTGTADPYTGTLCSTYSSYQVDVLKLFGSQPYVTVEKYADGAKCDGTKLASITIYLADGKCHKTASAASYTATRAADGSAIVKTYTNGVCSGSSSSTLTVTVAQAKGNSCADDENGVVNRKVYGSGKTLYLTSTVSYDTIADSCKSPGLAVQATTASVSTTNTCTPTTTCSNSVAPFTGTTCSSTYSYKTDMAAAFGSNPYVIVEKYAATKSCVGSELASIDTYLADGVCHKTGSSASYLATRAADGTASIKTYTDSATCATTASLLPVTAAQATGNSCTAGATGILDTKVYGYGVTLYLTSTVVYDTNADNCKSPGVAIQATTTGVATMSTSTTATSCIAATQCSNSEAPFTGVMCGSPYSFKIDMATAFGSNPYVIVEKYADNAKCDGTKLSGMLAYVADGKCHKTGAAAGYAATRAADGSAIVKTYANALCTGSPATTLDATAAQVNGQLCAADKKVYGAGVTTVNLSSALGFDTNVGTCVSPVVPTSVTTTLTDSSTACTPSTACIGTADPYTGTSCSTYSSYQADVLKLFGTKPYVAVEKYTDGFSCDGTKLASITTYLADGKCHKTAAAASYTATRAVDGSAIVKTYANALCTGSAATTLDVTAAQANGQLCAADKKVYGAGVTTVNLSSALSFDTNVGSCVSPVVPTSLTTTLLAASSTACTPSTTCTGTADPYTGTSCSTYSSYQVDVLKLFGTKPYVAVEKYTDGAKCDGTKLASITTYLADGKCHKTAAAASYTATRAVDGSAIVKTYANALCTGSAATTLDVTAAQANGQLCAADKKVYGAGVTTVNLSSALGFDTNVGSCVSPVVPTSLTTTLLAASSTACTPSTTCTGTADPYTGTSCSTYSSYQADVLKLFGTKPYVAVEKYTDGAKCDGTKLASITTYLADGKCHKTGAATSYISTRAADGSATVTSYSKVDCSGTASPLVVTKEQATGNSCSAGTTGIADKKVYGSGATGALYSAIVLHDDKTCSAPVQMTVSTVLACTNAQCKPTGDRSILGACSEDYFGLATTLLGSKPFVVLELYNEATCTTKKGAIVYLADGECHSQLDGASSFKITLAASGVGAILEYEGAGCASTTPKTTPLTRELLTSHSCTEGKMLYAFNALSTDPPATNPPVTSAPETPATTPTPTTTTSTGSGTSDAALGSVLSLLVAVAVFGGAALLL